MLTRGSAISTILGGTRGGFGGASLSRSAAAGAAVSLSPGAVSAPVTGDAGCSVVAGSDHAAGVDWRGRVIVSDAISPWYTRFSAPPCWPVDGLLDRFGCFRHDTRAAGGERAPRVEI